MKKTVLLTLIIVFVISGCTKNNRSPIIGAWKNVYGISITKDTTIKLPPFKDHYIKMIGDKHFTTIWQDTSLNKEDYWRSGFNGGTYTFVNGIYTENLSYFSSTGSIGKQFSFRTEFKDDTLILTFIPEDPNNTDRYIEKMVRLE